MRRLLLVLLTPFACTGSGDDTDDVQPMICLDVTGTVDASGLEIQKPTRPVEACRYKGIDVENAECEKTEPDLSCVGTTNTATAASVSVTYTGCVSSFGLMAQSDDLVVTVLREEAGGSPTDPGYDVDGTPGSRAEKTPAAVIGKTISVSVPAAECPDLGKFTIADVPTETPLIIRVTDQHLDNGDRQYVNTYQYNIILRNALLRETADANGTVVTNPEAYCASNECFLVDDVNTVIEQTFTTIALTAGVSRIEGDDDLYDGTGQGHVAGEIQDCTDDNTLQNAAVALSSDVRKLAFFNVGFPPGLGNLEDPKVDQSRSNTNADGLYAAIAVDTQDGGQPVDVAAAITTSICGTDGVCRCMDGMENPGWIAPDTDGSEANTTLLGKRTIYVYPDSITILTFDSLLYAQ